MAFCVTQAGLKFCLFTTVIFVVLVIENLSVKIKKGHEPSDSFKTNLHFDFEQD